MKEFIEYLLQFGNLKKHQIDLIASKGIEARLGKDDYFAEAGKVLKQVGFILDGILRICYYNNKGEEITKIHFSDSFASQCDTAEYFVFSHNNSFLR